MNTDYQCDFVLGRIEQNLFDESGISFRIIMNQLMNQHRVIDTTSDGNAIVLGQSTSTTLFLIGMN